MLDRTNVEAPAEPPRRSTTASSMSLGPSTRLPKRNGEAHRQRHRDSAEHRGGSLAASSRLCGASVTLNGRSIVEGQVRGLARGGWPQKLG